jgi:putative nucleotidyltransferase with HDIG domain
MPAVATRVLQLVSNENLSLLQLSEVICSDQAFASEILMIVNSALYALREPVTSVLQGVAVLGLDRLKGLALTVAVRSYLGGKLSQPGLRTLWRHNLCCALIAEEMSAVRRLDAGTAYTAGLMHDIGRVAFAAIQPDAYAALLQEYQGTPEELLQAERNMFELDHCEAGQYLATEWKLPAVLVQSIAKHHLPGTDHGTTIPSMIALSCRLADAIGFPVCRFSAMAEYDTLRRELPQTARSLFRLGREEAAFAIASKINCLEAS